MIHYEIIVKLSFNQQQYVQNQDDDNEHLFVNWRFRRDVSSFNRRDNNINFRENFNFNNYHSRVQLDSKSASFAKNLIADSLIIRKTSAINSKSVSRIVFFNSKHVQDLIVVWNNTSLIIKTSMMRTIISINTLRNYRSTLFSKTFRLALLWSSSMNILKHSMNRKRNTFWSRSNH
jgi:hypothetical protein